MKSPLSASFARFLPIALVAVLVLTGLTRGGRSFAQEDTSSQAPATPNPLGPPEPFEVSEHRVDWPVAMGDYAGHRAARESAITASAVDQLNPTWAFQIPGTSGYGAVTGVPIVVGETVYLQDMASNVFALDRATGDVAWARYYNSPGAGPNGVAVGYGMVFGALGFDASVFALDSRTGQELWRTPLSHQPGIGIDVAPAVYDNVVYISTVPINIGNIYRGGNKGALFALDAKTGNILWTWETTTDNLWGSARINAGGGLWYPPSFDEQGNLYFGVGNPAPWPGVVADGTPYPNGSSRPGPNLYTDSMVSLDPRTASLRWYYQAHPHDLFDRDFMLTPILATVVVAGAERNVAIGSGKGGIVVAVDADTGEVLWKTSVGKHQNDDLTAIPDGERIQVYPGGFGGVETPMAFADGTVFVPVVNLATTYTALVEAEMDLTSATSELIAINAADGSITWDVEVPTMVLGGAVVANDVVFTAGLDGLVRGFSTADGTQIWNYQAPAGINAPLAVAGATLLVPAGTFMFPPTGGYTAEQPEPPKQPLQFQLIALRLHATGPLTVVTPPPPTAETPAAAVTDATAAPAAAATPAPPNGAGATPAQTVKMVDLAFDPDAVTIPANTATTIALPNAGAVTHDFTIDALKIHVTVNSGDTGSVTIDAPAGSYPFYCSIPGHKESGMAGTLTVN